MSFDLLLLKSGKGRVSSYSIMKSIQKYKTTTAFSSARIGPSIACGRGCRRYTCLVAFFNSIFLVFVDNYFHFCADQLE